jgi:hypothetical protein
MCNFKNFAIHAIEKRAHSIVVLIYIYEVIYAFILTRNYQVIFLHHVVVLRLVTYLILNNLLFLTRRIFHPILVLI